MHINIKITGKIQGTLFGPNLMALLSQHVYFKPETYNNFSIKMRCFVCLDQSRTLWRNKHLESPQIFYQ